MSSKERNQELSYQFHHLFSKQRQKLRLIWLGIFFAIFAYMAIAYFINFTLISSSELVIVLPWCAGGCALFSFYLYNSLTAPKKVDSDVKVHFFERLLGEKLSLSELSEISKLSGREQKIILNCYAIRPGLIMCWGINELVAFFGLLNVLIEGGSFQISIYYFLIALVLNYGMRPPIEWILKEI